MAKRKLIENGGSEAVANPDSAPPQPQPETELPSVESPSISPEKLGTAIKPDLAETSAEHEIVAPASASRPRSILRPRQKRHVLFAASVAVAAAFGAIVGAVSTGWLFGPAAGDIAAEENKATQQSVARLSKEINNLKTSLEAANKSAFSQIAKISERLGRESAQITGSITPPQTTAPLPNPRPAPAAETRPAGTGRRCRGAVPAPVPVDHAPHMLPASQRRSCAGYRPAYRRSQK